MSTLSSGLNYRIILFLLVCIFAIFRSHEPLKPWVIYYSFLHHFGHCLAHSGDLAI